MWALLVGVRRQDCFHPGRRELSGEYLTNLRLVTRDIRIYPAAPGRLFPCSKCLREKCPLALFVS
jgi:hypothetical protein